jgi:hypothetical protein
MQSNMQNQRIEQSIVASNGEHADDPLIGTTLEGKFEILELLG